MGLFGSKEPCCICGGKSRRKITDGYLCQECFTKYANATYVAGDENWLSELPTKIQAIEAIESKKENDEILAKFDTTKQIDNLIKFDEDKKMFIVLNGQSEKSKMNKKVYDCNKLIGYEILENGEIVTQGGLGSAIVGGTIFGGSGAVVGAIVGKKATRPVINELKIKLTLDDFNSPAIYIYLIKNKTKSNSIAYKTAYSQAQEILSILSVITKRNDTDNIEQSIKVDEQANDSFDKIKKLKELLDLDAITQEEYNKKKKELLNL